MQIFSSQNFKKYQGKEDDFQKSVAAYLDAKMALWFHSPNGGSRNVVEATKLKKMGVKSGIPDCLVMNRRKNYNGLALELKVGYNKPSANQIEYMQRLENEGWLCAVSWSLDECIALIEWYFS